MKIELTLPALERLLNGDSEIELCLKKQVVNEFARRHLKEVAESEAYRLAVDETKSHVNELVKSELGVENVVKNNVWPTLDQRLRSMIVQLADNVAKDAIQKAVDDKISKWSMHWSNVVRDGIKQSIDRAIEDEVQKRVVERLRIAYEGEKASRS